MPAIIGPFLVHIGDMAVTEIMLHNRDQRKAVALWVHFLPKPLKLIQAAEVKPAAF